MTVIDEIAAERARQITDERWTPHHDDDHREGELAGAAACYAMHNLAIQSHILRSRVADLIVDLWPWHQHWWKPTTPRRNLVKAAALIVAEIERRDRAAAPP